FEHVEETDEIRVDVRRGVLDRVAHPGLRREVHHRVEFLRREKPCHALLLDDVELAEIEAGARLEAIEPRLLQPHIVVIVQIVDAHDAVTAIEQAMRERGADETRGPGNKNFHLPATPPILLQARTAAPTPLSLYPWGFWLCQRQVSRHMSSIPCTAFQPSRRSASEGSAYDSATSPARLATFSVGMVRPLARSKARTASSTEMPRPVPRLTVKPRPSRRSASSAARCPRARSTTCM